MRHLLIVFLILAIVFSLAPLPVTSSSSAARAVATNVGAFGYTIARAYVSPVLLEDSYWTYGAYVESEELLSVDVSPFEGSVFNILNKGEALGRVVIVVDGKADIGILRGKIRGLLGVYPTHIGYVVYALVARSDIEPLSRTPGVLALLPDVRLDAVINRQIMLARHMEEELAAEALQGGSASGGGVYHYTVDITGARRVWEEFGVRGEGVTIAIIDTGVDYGSPALGLESIARDETGRPLIFDVSSLGLVLTPAPATPTGTGFVRVDFSKLYAFVPPYYVISWNEPYLYVGVRGCTSVDAYVPASLFWHVGDLQIAAGKFGLLFQLISASVGGVSSRILYTVPVLVVDVEGDSVYDYVLVDTTTALYLLSIALRGCGTTIPGAPAEPDFSFADETRVEYGREVIARDLNGDGVNDYSVGALAGYVYDAAFAIIFEKIGAWKELMEDLPFGWGYSVSGPSEIWFYEPIALVWPGFDPAGDYVVIAYDFHSHGTFCASTAAGRDYYAQTGYGVRSIAGQAPGAKIAAAPALFMGTVLTSIYFFTGFDIETPYGIGSTYLWPILATNPWVAFEGYTWKWSYTGKPRVDMTSNSYGISGWALWGWASGMDPVSAVFDYTTLVSRVPHFIAVGNGGPGWGTIASPGSSTLSIGVGAATEFTYRPLYAYAWPGSSRQVVTWSNRGPTELGVVKPDLVAVGSFAWAVGRTWEALAARTLDGRQTHGLFSGTSQATPMAAGVGALVAAIYKSTRGEAIPAHVLKTILMNTANDMGYDELSQGAGFVDAYEAVRAVLDPRYPRVYSTSILADLAREIGATLEAATYGGRLGGTWFEPKIFVPEVSPGRTAVRTLILEGRGVYTITPVRLRETTSLGLCEAVRANLNPAIIVRCVGEDVTLRVTAASVFGHLVIDLDRLRGFDYFEIQLIYPYRFFESGGRTGGFAQLISLTHIELAYWIDVGADGRFSWLETARIMYDIRGANALRIQIGDLEGQLREIEELAARYMGVDVTNLPKYLVVRIGVSGATFRGDLPMKVKIVGYNYERWDDVRVTPSRISVASTARVVVTIRGPSAPGFYSGYLVVEESRQGFRALVPVSFFVPLEVTRAGTTITLEPRAETTIYKNTALRGAFDYTWRYESGDWRVFKVRISSTLRDAWALAVGVSWPVTGDWRYASNIDVHVYGPYTYYMVDGMTGAVTTVKVNGLQLAAELTIDPALTAGRNPRRFWDSVAPGYSAIITPVERSETYRVVVRNIQYSGLAFEEPVTITFSLLTARATTTTRAPGVFESTITVRGAPDLLPTGLAWSGDAIVRLESGELLYAGGLVEVELVRYEVSRDTARAVIRIYLAPEAPPGAYIVPVLLATPLYVTTVGYVDVTPNYYFTWNFIPVNVTFEYK